MHQVETFLAEEDLEQVMALLIARGCWLVPDLDYQQPSAMELRSIDEFRRVRRQGDARFFMVLNADWLRCPLELAPMEKAGKQLYFVHQKTGGPTLDIFAPYEVESDGKMILPWGFIGLHSKFWNSSTQSFEKPGKLVKDTFGVVKKQLATHSGIQQLEKRRCLIAKGAQKRMQAGVVLEPPF